LFDARFRTALDRVVSPAGKALRRTGLAPDHLTALGIALSVPAAWAIATGHLIVGLLLFIASALPDLFDGSLAKASGRASQRGAFFDSVGDRVSDTIVLAGFAWYVQDRFGGHAALVPLAVLGASQLVSYIRAKGDALGIDAHSGLMERGERIVVLCAALVFSAQMLWLLWAIFALSVVTAGQRFMKVWGQANKPPAPLPVEPAAVVLRWRAWREERAGREASWWARAPRGPGASTSGFFSGSRRPGGGAAGGRWHERRVARRKRFPEGGFGAGAGDGSGQGQAELGDKIRTRRHTGSGRG
jgi:CDP-diacylglycerol---glycerol-3-phosphate 3-phosphatidyltransferase